MGDSDAGGAGILVAESGGGMAATGRYDAFISYSHQHDGALAPVLQGAVERFAKPWYRMRALRVFRDEANLAANPGLWESVEAALASSEWFILLASEPAAASQWVNREVAWWLNNRSPDRMLILATSPGLDWDAAKGDWTDGAPVPPALRGGLRAEPRWVDMSGVQVTRGRGPGLSAEQVAEVAAPIRSVDKDQLIGEHVRQHRRTMRLVRGAVAILTALTAVSVTASIVAVGQRDNARTQAAIATAGEVAALAAANVSTHLDAAQLLAVEAVQLRNDPQSRAALFEAVTASPYLQRYLAVGAQVDSLAASADGNVVVAGTTDGHIVRFDLATGARAEVAAGHGPIEGVAVSADGAVVGAYNSTRGIVWATGSGRAPVTFNPGGSISLVAMSPSGRWIALLCQSGSLGSQTVAVRDIRSGHQARTGNGAALSAGSFYGIGFPADTTLVLTGPNGFEELDPSDLRTISQAAGPTTPANSFTFGTSPDGVYSGYAKSGVTEYPTASIPRVTSFMAGNLPVPSTSYLTFSDDGKAAASIDDGTIYVSPLAASGAGGAPVELTANIDTSEVSFLGSRDRLVSAAGNTLALWNLQQSPQLGPPTGISVAGYQTAASPVALSISPDGRYLAIGNYNGGTAANPSALDVQAVSVYRNGRTVTPVSVWHQDGTPVWDGDRLLLAGTDVAGRHLEITEAGGRVLKSWPYTPVPGTASWLGELPGDRQIALLAGGNEHLFSLQDGTSTSFAVRAHLGFQWTGSLAISPDGTGLAAVQSANGIAENAVYVNLRTGATRIVGTGTAANIAFTAHSLLIERSSGNVEEWDLTGQRLLLTVPGGGTGLALAVSSDGTTLARIGTDGTMPLSDLGTGQILATFSLPAATDTSDQYYFNRSAVIFSPDNRYLFTATPGGALTRWDIGTQDLMKIACTRAGSALTPDVWTEYVHTNPPPNLACQGTSPSSSAVIPVAASSTASPSAEPSTTAATQSPSTSPTAALTGQASVVQDYIGAINAHDYGRAWALGGKNLGESYSAFAAGFAGTSRDILKVTNVQGNVVTAELIAIQTNGTRKAYAGTYTVQEGAITQFQIQPAG